MAVFQSGCWVSCPSLHTTPGTAGCLKNSTGGQRRCEQEEHAAVQTLTPVYKNVNETSSSAKAESILFLFFSNSFFLLFSLSGSPAYHLHTVHHKNFLAIGSKNMTVPLIVIGHHSLNIYVKTHLVGLLHWVGQRGWLFENLWLTRPRDQLKCQRRVRVSP